MNNGLSQEINSLLESYIKPHIDKKTEVPDLSKDLTPQSIWFVLKEFVHPSPQNVRRSEKIFDKAPLDPNTTSDTYMYFVFLEGDSEYYFEFDGLYWVKFETMYFSLDGKCLDKEKLGSTYIKCDNFNHKEKNRILYTK